MAPTDEGGFQGQKDLKVHGDKRERVGFLASLGFKETQEQQ